MAVSDLPETRELAAHALVGRAREVQLILQVVRRRRSRALL